jgi:hypothetical protein
MWIVKQNRCEALFTGAIAQSGNQGFENLVESGIFAFENQSILLVQVYR